MHKDKAHNQQEEKTEVKSNLDQNICLLMAPFAALIDVNFIRTGKLNITRKELYIGILVAYIVFRLVRYTIKKLKENKR